MEVRKFADTSIFKTDVKRVFDLIRCSKDKQKLREWIEDLLRATEDREYREQLYVENDL